MVLEDQMLRDAKVGFPFYELVYHNQMDSYHRKWHYPMLHNDVANQTRPSQTGGRPMFSRSCSVVPCMTLYQAKVLLPRRKKGIPLLRHLGRGGARFTPGARHNTVCQSSPISASWLDDAANCCHVLYWGSLMAPSSTNPKQMIPAGNRAPEIISVPTVLFLLVSIDLQNPQMINSGLVFAG